MVLIMREGLRAEQRRLVGEKVWFHGEAESCIIPRLASALCLALFTSRVSLGRVLS
jgi:hypothetical protein